MSEALAGYLDEHAAAVFADNRVRDTAARLSRFAPDHHLCASASRQLCTGA
ncbi:hypothetical protein ACFXNW_12385 [Nocardia sp. NPDC059180]|uniref:hypothetical protein n=1 Tax=Nocardia sp. NPDC059180 TaxID=3346761 RepID=UPI0036A9DE0E